MKVHVVATDANTVCVERNRERDAEHLAAESNDDNSSSTLRYEALNIAADPRNRRALHQQWKDRKFNVVIDKGCLDTFLFRSKKRGGLSSALMQRILSNTCSMMRVAEDDVDETQCGSSRRSCCYLVLSSRTRFRELRDSPLFDVTRERLDLQEYAVGDLVRDATFEVTEAVDRTETRRQREKQDATVTFAPTNTNNSSNKKRYIYLYVCRPKHLRRTAGMKADDRSATAPKRGLGKQSDAECIW